MLSGGHCKLFHAARGRSANSGVGKGEPGQGPILRWGTICYPGSLHFVRKAVRIHGGCTGEWRNHMSCGKITWMPEGKVVGRGQSIGKD